MADLHWLRLLQNVNNVQGVAAAFLLAFAKVNVNLINFLLLSAELVVHSLNKVFANVALDFVLVGQVLILLRRNAVRF